MLHTHIFLVILTTVVFIIFTEYQKLRKLSWIFFIGCISYIFLVIAPENAQLINNEYAEFTNIDSAMSTDMINQEANFYDGGNDLINESKISDMVNSEETNDIDEIQKLDIVALLIATDIFERIPIGKSNNFLNDIDTLFCFTAVNNPKVYNKIVHTWRYNNQDYAKSYIDVGYSTSWRCWSKLTIRPDMIGDWQVIIQDTLGNHLDSIDFSIIPKNN